MTAAAATPKPLIGILADNREVATLPASTVLHRYIRAVAIHARANVVLVPSIPELIDVQAVAERLDALLLGGAPSNMEPWRYGREEPGVGPFDPGRDDVALSLTRAMLAEGAAVFGICRGFQELNVAMGGSLRPDLGDGAVTGLAHHSATTAIPAIFAHRHALELPNGSLFEGLSPGGAEGASVHYQGVRDLAPGVTVEATAPDGLVEAFSWSDGHGRILAVQWHPEEDADTNPVSRRFFEALHAAAEARRLRRG